MKRTSEIVGIGKGLCRLTVKSRKQRDLYARIPGVWIDDRDAEYLGYRVIFPERMRGMIESTLQKGQRKPEKPPQPVQMGLSLMAKQEGGDQKKSKRKRGGGRRKKTNP